MSLALSLIGLGISAYLTYEHYTGSTTLACSSTGTVDCHKVTTSTYAELFGIPVALLGLLFYVVMTALCLPAMWRHTGAVEYARWAALAGGLVMVLYLIWAEFQLSAICLWCSGVHAVTLLLVLATMLAEASTLRGPLARR